MASNPKQPDPVRKAAEFADGQPVDRLAADRYARTGGDLPAAVRLAASPNPKVSKTGRLRCAAILAGRETSKADD